MNHLQIKSITLGTEPGLSLFDQGPVTAGFTHLPHGIEQIEALFTGRDTIELHQTHSGIILDAILENRDLDGDGLIARDARIIPVIRTADCIPLFFWHPEAPFFGILHIGWRGFVAAIQRTLLDKARQEGIDPSSLMFLIGPGICARHYEVGPEVLDQFRPIIPPERISTPTDQGKALLDLKQAIRLDLINHVIPPKQITDLDICTFEETDHLPSHRRRPNGGRMFNFICLNGK